MRTWNSMGLIGVVFWTGCESAPPPPPAIQFEATAVLDGSNLKVEMAPGFSPKSETFSMSALGAYASYWGAGSPPGLSIDAGKVPVGAANVAVTAGATTKEIPIVATSAWAPSASTKKTSGLSNPAIFESPSLGGPITVPLNVLQTGVILKNLRSATALGWSLPVKDNQAYLYVDLLQLFADRKISELLPNDGRLKDRDAEIVETFPLEIVAWSGETTTHQVKLRMTRTWAQIQLRDRLRELLEKPKLPAERRGGRAAFVGSRGVGDGRVVGKAKTFGDIGYVAFVDPIAGSERRAGKCRYVGARVDVFVGRSKVTLRSLADGEVVAERELKGRRGRCPSTLYRTSANRNDPLYYYPRDDQAARWVKRALRKVSRRPKQASL